MKNRSIKIKLTLWFALILLITVLITFIAIRISSGMVLKGAIRDYLITTVEENTDKILYLDKKPETDSGADVYIPYEEGFLAIDADFLDVINDVYAALYTQDGTMLYGENPMEKEVTGTEFTESYIWTKKVDGIEYMFYDRSLATKLPNGESLWIRGVVPETRSEIQLDEISRISAWVLPIILIIIAAIVYFIIDRLLKPLSEIEKTADHISRGDDLKERLTIEGDDEVGRLAKAFNRMLDRLEKSFVAEKQFTQDASHELRTPTSVLLAQSEYILEKERTAEEYKEALEVVHRQSLRMNDLIGDMLDYTRMNQQSERYAMEDVSLSEIATEVAGQMALIGGKGISLSSNIEEGIRVNGNTLLLSRMIQNLVGNAYRYGKENGHILLDLKKVSDEEGDFALISVKDDGIGISKEDVERIFDRFFRSDSSRSDQGTGLGLAMVKKIAELHSGTVDVESILGVGTEFKIKIPL